MEASGVDVAAVTDLDESRVREARDKFDVPHGFMDVKEMLETVQPDIVDVCTPPQTHADIGVTAMEHGSHVIVEKPLALTSEDADRLADCAEVNDRKLCTVHQMLFYPPVMKARRFIGESEIGTVHGARVFISTPAERYQLDEESWVHDFQGGVLEETGPHAIYLSQPFIGEVIDITATGRKHTDAPWAKEDDFAIQLVGSKATSSIRIIHHSDYRAAELDVWGDEGRLKIDLQTMHLYRYERDDLKNVTRAASDLQEGLSKIGSVVSNGVRTVTNQFTSGHERVIQKFADAVVNDDPSPVTVEHARDNVHILESCVQGIDHT
jgi:predicted dehydrogenase